MAATEITRMYRSRRVVEGAAPSGVSRSPLHQKIFLSILCAALGIRVFVALACPNIIALDEIFQYLEPAHRLVFGHSIIPWEYQVGLRNWLIPLGLAIPMGLTHLAFSNPLAGLIVIRILLCAASLSIVWCAASWGAQFYGRQGAWIAGLFAAFWPDLWVFAPHSLEEVFAADIFVPALYLTETIRHRPGLRHVALTAFLLGATAALRVQLAPAIAIAGVALCGRDLTRWRAALAAGAIPLALAGLLDWISWGEPFRSFWLNFYLNIWLGVSKSTTGGSPPAYYLYLLALDWLWTLPVNLYLAWRGAQFLPVTGLVILAIILPHMLISHKEFRYIFPAITLAVPLAGIGLAGLFDSLAERKIIWRRAALLGLLLTGPACSPYLYFTLRFQNGSFAAFETLASEHPALTALGKWPTLFVPLDILLDRNSQLTDLRDLGSTRPDAIMALQNDPSVPHDARLQSCYPGVWIPFASHPNPMLCIWTLNGADVQAKNWPPPEFPFPQAALPFRIEDRLTDGRLTNPLKTW